MKITIEVPTESLKEIEIDTPCYYRNGNVFFKILSENTGVRLWVCDKKATITNIMLGSDLRDAVNGGKIDLVDFEQAFIEAKELLSL